jgi:hypothetical protein
MSNFLESEGVEVTYNPEELGLPPAVLYQLPEVLTELVVRLTGGGKPLNGDLTALRHSQ